MADAVSNSSSNCTIHITNVDGNNLENENMENKNIIDSNSDDNSKENQASLSGSQCSDLAKETVPVLRPSTFLRPSALSGGALKANASGNAAESAPKLVLSSNKFANPDTSVDSLFNIPSSSEKKESKATLPTTVSIPAPAPLSNPDYVFGQNLLARVAERPESVSNGTSNMLFSAALSDTGNEAGSAVADTKESSSLLEDAARCQEQRAQKRKYEEVLVTTGEENEKNVLQVAVKLFAFEGGSWVERGRGNLRLNDVVCDTSGSRMVIRTMGSLRVVLNTKIWAEMDLSRVSEKSIRLSALDAAGQLKIFLIQASPSDITTLYNCLENRVQRCQVEEKTRTNSCNKERQQNQQIGDEDSPMPQKRPILEQTS